MTVAPEDVETMPAASFRVYQDNAAKFKHNDELTVTRSRQRRLEEAGAFRAPTNAQRSFQPQYGAVREVSSYDSMTVRATDGSETLLKHALPVPRGSAEPKARLTRLPVPLTVRQLRDFNPGPRHRREVGSRLGRPRRRQAGRACHPVIPSSCRRRRRPEWSMTERRHSVMGSGVPKKR